MPRGYSAHSRPSLLKTSTEVELWRVVKGACRKRVAGAYAVGGARRRGVLCAAKVLHSLIQS